MEPLTKLPQYFPTDFLYGPTLGEGRFGTVVYAELKTTSAKHDTAGDSRGHDAPSHCRRHARQRSQGYAVKMIPKSAIFRHNQIQAVKTEKYILSEMLSSSLPGSELFMKLFLCFHDANYLCLVLELCAGGTLLDLIQSHATNAIDVASPTPTMDISWVRYYACQILRAIEYLHQRGVVHRDITPQNIGLTFPKGEIKLGDFGAAAVFVKEDCEGASKLKRWMPAGTSTSGPENFSDFVGTADYVSPEMIRGSNDDKNQCEDQSNFPAMDLWSFGCVCYHMLVGKSPFHAASNHISFQTVSDFQCVLDYANGKSELCFPAFLDEDAKDMISSLLSINPANRLGMQDGVFESITSCNSAERDGTPILPSLERYQSIRDQSFFGIHKGASFFSSVESKSIGPAFGPAEPAWMAELQHGDITLKSLESIHFDL